MKGLRMVIHNQRLRVFIILLLVSCTFAAGCTAARSSHKEAAGEQELVEEPAAALGSLKAFTIGPGDEIALSVWNNPELDQEVVVSPSGQIAVSFVGLVDVSGKTVSELTQTLTNEFSKYYVDPVVAINIESSLSNKVAVLGEVRMPGVFNVDSQMQLVDAIASSGGLSPYAEPRSVALLRHTEGEPTAHLLNIKRFLEEGDTSQNPYLQRGDVVYVPRSFISKVDDFFEHFYTIIRPIVEVERGIALIPAVEDAFDDERAEVFVTR